MWFLIDRDEKNEEDIRKIQESLGNDVDSSVLSKREIENYLIHQGLWRIKFRPG